MTACHLNPTAVVYETLRQLVRIRRSPPAGSSMYEHTHAPMYATFCRGRRGQCWALAKRFHLGRTDLKYVSYWMPLQWRLPKATAVDYSPASQSGNMTK